MPQSPTPPGAPWRIAVDVGGTFTDMVLVDAGGRFHVFKTPLGPGRPEPRGTRRPGARVRNVRGEHRASPLGLHAVPARLHRRHQHRARGQRSTGGDARHAWLSGLPGGTARLSRRSVRPPPALPAGAGAAPLAPAGGRADGCAGHRGRTARRGGHRRRDRDLPCRRGGVDRGLFPAQLRERRPRATVRGGAARTGRLRMGVALPRGGSGHRRVRARLHHRRQRVHRSEGGALPAGSRRAPARPGPRTGPAGAAIERAGDLDPPGGPLPGEPRAVGTGGRGGRPRLLRRRDRVRRPHHHGDRWHLLRRHAACRRAGRGHRSAGGRRLRPGVGLGGHPHRRGRRGHHRGAPMRRDFCLRGRAGRVRCRGPPPTGAAARSPP